MTGDCFGGKNKYPPRNDMVERLRRMKEIPGEALFHIRGIIARTGK